jgi:hypothetical protein
MDPNIKLVLEAIQRLKDEISRHFDDHEAQWERWFTDLEFGHAVNDESVDKRPTSLESTRVVPDPVFERRLHELEGLCVDPNHGSSSWDPEVEHRLTALEAIRVEPNHDARVSALEQAVSDLGHWRLESEGLVDDLHQ